MKNSNRWIGAVVACAILISAGSALAQDWPQWRGPNRDGKATGFTAPAAWPKELTPKWTVKVGMDDSTPALVGDKLYVFARQGDEEVTLCLNAKDGNEIWRNAYKAMAIAGPSASVHPGPRSSPAVEGGKVVTLGVGGVLSCLDAKDGNVVWRKEDIKGAPKFYTASSPMVVDGLVIAQLGDAKGAIVAYDLAKGDEKWKCPGGSTYASPVLMTADGVKQIVTLTDQEVVGVAVADGKLLWHIPFAPSGMNYNAATPIVDGTTVIYTGSGRGTTAVKIEKKGDAFVATPLWKNDKVSTQFNTPVLKDGLLFGLSDKGALFCLDTKKDGKDVWMSSGVSPKGFGAIVDAGTVLLALPDSGDLIVYKPSAEKYDEVAKIKVGAAPYASPIVSGKNLYVKDKDSLMMYTLE